MGRHGENIRHRKDDDRWEGRYKVYHEEKKRYVYRSVYGHTYNEVKEKLSLERLAARNILYSSPDKKNNAVLFSRIADEWLQVFDLHQVQHNLQNTRFEALGRLSPARCHRYEAAGRDPGAFI